MEREATYDLQQTGGEKWRKLLEFKGLMLRHCQMMTQKAAAELSGISPSLLSDLLHRTITRLREGHRIVS